MAKLFEHLDFDDINNGSNQTYRIVIPSGELSGSASKITVKFAYDGTNWPFAKAYIGHVGVGDAYDFDGNQVQLLFSGNPGGTVTAGGLTSDEATINLTDLSNIVVAVYLSSSADMPRDTASSGYGLYYKVGDDAATTDATGYSTSAYSGQIHGVENITITDGPIEESIADTATLTDTAEALQMMDNTAETATITDTSDYLHLVDSVSETATLTDAVTRHTTSYRSTSETGTFTDAMEYLHMVESISDTAIFTDYMVGIVNDEIRRRRVKVNW